MKKLLLGIALAAYLVQGGRRKDSLACKALGDLVAYNDEGLEYCQSCSALYPGCKRCEWSILEFMDQQSGKYDNAIVARCYACDEGLYLYPFENTKYLSTTGVKATLYSCVPRCEALDFQSRGNPETGRCVYLGIGCKAGTYSEGCTEVIDSSSMDIKLQNDGAIKNLDYMRPGFDPFPMASEGTTITYKPISYIKGTIQKPQQPQQFKIENCLVALSQDICQSCDPGYLRIPSKADDTDLNYQISGQAYDVCVVSCDTGYYPFMTLTSNGEYRSYCAKCASTCYTCSGSDTCTSCNYNQYLDDDGACQPRITTSLSLSYTVTPDRATASTSTTFNNLLEAVYAAFQSTYEYQSAEVTIQLDSSDTHVINLEDFKSFGLLPDKLTLSPQFKLTITSDGEAQVLNKIGGRFQITAPELGLYVSNLIIDSVDSVIDPSYNNATELCAKSENKTSCCQSVTDPDFNINYVTCEFWNETSEKSVYVQPFYHLSQTCYHKPQNGIFVINRIPNSPVPPVVQINNCQFLNLYYELGSIVKVPVSDPNDIYDTSFTIEVPYNVSITNSKFENVSICGALFSNYFGHFYGTQSQNPNIVPTRTSFFDSQTYGEYFGYQEDGKYIELTRGAISGTVSYNEGRNTSNVTFSKNTIVNLNILKNTSDVNKDYLTRLQTQVEYSLDVGLRDHGLVIELYGNFTGGRLYFESNTITNAQNYHRYQLEEGDTVNHCEKSLSEQRVDERQYVTISTKNKAFHQTHLLSFNQMRTSEIFVIGNTISSTSLTGQLIFVDCVQNTTGQSLIFAGNQISYVHSYMSTGILKFIRYFLFSSKGRGGELVQQVHEDMTSETYKAYAEFGGGIMIQNNNINHVVGCPNTDTTVFNVAVALYDPYKMNSHPTFYRTLVYPNNQFFYDSSKYIIGGGKVENYEFLYTTLPTLHSTVLSEYTTERGMKYQSFQYRTVLKGNSYSELSMGVGNSAEASTLPSKGSLHKFNSIAVVHLVDERYQNIGGFTREHLAFVIGKVKGESTFLDQKPLFKVLEIDTSLNYYETKGAFYQNILSCTLIYGFSNMQLGIFGSSTFDNIWNIDKYGAFTTSQDESDPDFGLILNVKQFMGRLNIGGQDPGNSAQTETQTVTFQNLQGYLNDYTVTNYPDWDPLLLYTDFNEDNQKRAKLIKQGQGSMLFNIVKVSNYFREVTFTNVLIFNMFGRSEISLPTGGLIMDTKMGTNPFMNMLSISIDNMVVRRCRFENGKAFMELLTQVAEINRLQLDGISDNMGLSFLTIYDTNIQLTGMNYYPMVKPFFRIIMGQEKLGTGNFLNNITFTNSEFKNVSSLSSAIFESYIIKVKNNDVKYPQIDFNNCTFFGNIGQSQGSIFQDISEYELGYQIRFNNSRFISNMGKYGLMTISQQVNALIFDFCTFHNSQGNLARALYISSLAANEVNITNSVFSMTPVSLSDVREVLGSELGIDNVQFNQPSQLVLTNFLGTFYSKNITGQYLSNSHYGSFLSLESGSDKVTLDNSTFVGCNSLYGGVITVQTASILKLSDSYFYDNSANTAGVFFLNTLATMEADNIVVKGSFARQAAVFRVSGGSAIKLSNSLLYENSATYENSIGMIIEAKDLVLFENVTFTNNVMLDISEETQDKGIEITATSVLVAFKSCNFFNNQARYITANLYMNKALMVQIEDTYFKNTDPLTYSAEDIKGGFIHMIGGSIAYISDSKFYYGQANQGGAIFMLGDTSLTLQTCDFQGNYALNRGGAIAAITFSSITIELGTYFFNNKAGFQIGDVIYALNTDNHLSVNSSNFYNSISQNFMYLQDIANLNLVSTIFEAPSVVKSMSNTQVDSALVLSNVQNMTIDGSVFKNLVSNVETYAAGAIYITQSAIIKKSSGILKISHSRFENCQGINGGALNIFDVQGVYIGNGTQFNGNKASKNGGAINFQCQNHGSDLKMCSLTFENQVNFTGNSAGEEGGAIKWNYYEPINVKTQGYYIRNKAGLYGNDIAAVPQKLLNLQSKTSSARALGSSSYSSGAIDGVVSGGSINMAFSLQDKYGQVVTTDSSSKLFISSVVSQETSTGFVSSIESTTQFACENGTFTVTDFKFVGQPNSTRSIKIRTDGIDYGIPTNEEYRQERLKAASAALGKKNVDGEKLAEYNQELQEMSESVFVDLSIRSCLPGEELLSSGKCHKCEAGKYLLLSPDVNTPTACIECPSSEKAECEGGNEIYPKAGYWRSSIYSDNFIECRNDVACLGRNGDENNLLGACNVGYQGTLCVDCQVGFSRTGSSYKCSRCPDKADNSTRIAFLFLAMIIAIVLLVRSSLAGALEKKNYLSVFIRILMNHFQLLTLTASFDLDWPDELKNFFQATKPVSEVTTQFLSFDCFVDTRKSDGSEELRVFYSKMIMMAAIPFIIMAISFLVWNALYLFKRDPRGVPVQPLSNQSKVTQDDLSDTSISDNAIHKQMMMTDSFKLKEKDDEKQGRIVSTIIIVLFLVHPTITTIMFNAFNCQNIDGTSYLYEDLQIECNVGSHRLYSLAIALPSIVIWGVGIPTIALVLLYQRRKDLMLTETKAKFGFLYNGYRIPQAYYWELIIMYRKIAVIFIQVFLAQLGKIVQALTMLLFLIICLTITAAKQPFSNYFLNSLEALSLLSSAVTVYCGLFYIAKASFKKESNFEMSTEAELFLFITIIVTHIGFLVYWAYHFLREIRATIRSKVPSLYIALFLCCRKGALERELQVEDARDRLGPMLQSIDKFQDYLQERKMMYISGQVPWEDDAFKKLVGMCKGYVDRVEKMMAYSLGEGTEKSLAVADLMQDKQRSSVISKLRPKNQNTLKRKMLGVDRLVMALDSDFGGVSQPKLKQIDELQSQIGFDDEGPESPKARGRRVTLPRFESRNELEEHKETFGDQQYDDEVMDFNDEALNQLSQEIEASNITLITHGPLEEKKFMSKRYSQGELQSSMHKGLLLMGATPESKSPKLELDLIGEQAHFGVQSHRVIKELPDFYQEEEVIVEPPEMVQQTNHRASMDDAVTILQRSSTKAMVKAKSKGSISSSSKSGKIKESRFRMARKEAFASSIIDLQGIGAISEEEDERPRLPNLNVTDDITHVQISSREVIRGGMTNNLLLEDMDEQSVIEEEMHRVMRNQ